MKNLWWGYSYINGSIQVKRYFDEQDLKEANESSFVDTVFKPFKAKDREEAIKIIKDKV